MKAILLSLVFLAFAENSWSYYSNSTLTKESAKAKGFPLEVSFKRSGETYQVTVLFPAVDQEMICENQISITRELDGVTTFRSSSIHAGHQDREGTMWCVTSFSLSEEELKHFFLHISYRQTQFGGNGWGYKIDIGSFFDVNSKQPN